MTTLKSRLRILVLVAVAGAALATGAWLAVRRETVDVDWLVKVLELGPGSVVADIGAGRGPITLALAERVDSSGRVYSSELPGETYERLRAAIDSSGFGNVILVEAHPKKTNLPEECCDALLMRRVYHHIDHPAEMNASLFRSLKPGGRLAIIDFAPRESEAADPAERDSEEHHGVTEETVVKELKEAGFLLVVSEERSGRDVYLVFRKPEPSGS